MFVARLSDDFFDVDFLSQAGIQLPDADLDCSAKLGERFNTLQQFATELFLRCFRQGGGLRDCQLERFHHSTTIHANQQEIEQRCALTSLPD
jgi:hypothetical protein